MSDCKEMTNYRKCHSSHPNAHQKPVALHLQLTCMWLEPCKSTSWSFHRKEIFTIHQSTSEQLSFTPQSHPTLHPLWSYSPTFISLKLYWTYYCGWQGSMWWKAEKHKGQKDFHHYDNMAAKTLWIHMIQANWETRLPDNTFSMWHKEKLQHLVLQTYITPTELRTGSTGSYLQPYSTPLMTCNTYEQTCACTETCSERQGAIAANYCQG